MTIEIRRDPRHRISMLVNDWDLVWKAIEAAKEVVIDSGFTDIRVDETYGPHAEDFPASYTVLHAALAGLGVFNGA